MFFSSELKIHISAIDVATDTRATLLLVQTTRGGRDRYWKHQRFSWHFRRCVGHLELGSPIHLVQCAVQRFSKKLFGYVTIKTALPICLRRFLPALDMTQ